MFGELNDTKNELKKYRDKYEKLKVDNQALEKKYEALSRQNKANF